jgi:hypothetical protein
MKKDQERTAQADRQPENIQETVQFLPSDDSDRGPKIVLQHDSPPGDIVTDKPRQRSQQHGPKPDCGPGFASILDLISVRFFKVSDCLIIILIIQKQPKKSFPSPWQHSLVKWHQTLI